jgi:hypothetical protein
MFGHIRDDEISKKGEKKYTGLQPITAAMCTITINVLEPRAFNLESEFHTLII